MSAEATAAVMASAPEPPTESTSPLLDGSHDHAYDEHCLDAQSDAKVAGYAGPEPHTSPKPIGLHSPPDSNNAMKLDSSDDSELSDVEDPTLETDQVPLFPTQPTTQQAPEMEDEDIGEVTPHHWSGTVPVFKPDMHQFKDFKKFVRCQCVASHPRRRLSRY
jgi:hypothetical protein